MVPRLQPVNPAGEMVQGHQVCPDIQSAKPKAGLLAVVESDSQNWPHLPQVKGLTRLWAYGVKSEQLAIISQLTGLELLCLSTPKCSDFSLLAKLKNLTTLVIDNAHQLTDLSFIAALPKLTAVHLSDMKRLTDIRPLAKCKSLVELHLESGMWNELTLDSLEPLRHLKQLKYLGLSPVMKKPTLEPLRELTSLQELSLNGKFPFEDYVRLAGKLRKTKCKHFKDMFSDFSNIRACRRCKQKKLLIGVWLKGPRLCVQCDAEKIQAWRKDFARLRDEAAQRSTW